MINEILLNLYAQDKVSIMKIEKFYENLNEDDKLTFVNDIIFLVIASNPNEKFLDEALKNSGYKNTINYYNMLRSKRDTFQNNIFKIKSLKGTPFKQGLILLLELFKVTYSIKREKCIKGGEKCNHWWHLDLSESGILLEILQMKFDKSNKEANKIFEEIKKYF